MTVDTETQPIPERFDHLYKLMVRFKYCNAVPLNQ